ncbi:MaoC family dehydratase [Haladaptatus halobius]|uniref:MaoC family dehydratase n=1 Tax=Haladaptatus halobius TaxID=2884875 RepID=UPI001D09C33F|nr:MaoC family dehydratase [Haladaptatus halobius]
MSVRFFEDLSTGESHKFGGRTVTKQEILSFAEKYDPQPFHLDERAAEDSVFSGLVASGWHTVCLLNRMLVDGFVRDTANMGGRGADDVRWHRPLRPGTTLSGCVEVLEKTLSKRHPDRGYVTYEFTAFDEEGERLVSLTAELLVRRRKA